MDALPEELVMEPRWAEVCLSVNTCICMEYLFLKRVSVVSDRLVHTVVGHPRSFGCCTSASIWMCWDLLPFTASRYLLKQCENQWISGYYYWTLVPLTGYKRIGLPQQELLFFTLILLQTEPESFSASFSFLLCILCCHSADIPVCLRSHPTHKAHIAHADWIVRNRISGHHQHHNVMADRTIH